MKIIALLIGFCFNFNSAFAQIEADFSFVSEEDNRLIKESDSGKFFVASGDTSRIIFLNDEAFYYRLLSKNKKVLAEGNFSNEGEKFYREGKWNEYYEDGKIKNTGHYYKNYPMGLWQRFYPNGKLKSLINYAIVENGANYFCMSGSFQDFFENGQIKTSGFYKATIDDKSKDTVIVEDPVSGRKFQKIEKGKNPHPEKFGTWEYFSDSGELLKKEEFQ